MRRRSNTRETKQNEQPFGNELKLVEISFPTLFFQGDLEREREWKGKVGVRKRQPRGSGKGNVVRPCVLCAPRNYLRALNEEKGN
ncbi:hypothetical protein CEXT_325921 [Caerostris extrusa]|uniref:Uncharacterized protein n=1 Tax=Caerostris extrusa TaxID=172846 RepID=A0AAV4S9C4_CAEEX|nr:hypothetical protein CEXT_325921 [Caerostris extrusa]